MNGYVLGRASRDRLQGVNEALVRVVERAILITRQDFTVLEGLRTVARQQEYLAAGTSRTPNSRHLTGHAVDLIPHHVGGGRVWPEHAKTLEERNFRFRAFELVAAAMLEAADILNVPLQWGNDWDGDGIPTGQDRDERGNIQDMPHFQLPWPQHVERAREASIRRRGQRAAGVELVL